MFQYFNVNGEIPHKNLDFCIFISYPQSLILKRPIISRGAFFWTQHTTIHVNELPKIQSKIAIFELITPKNSLLGLSLSTNKISIWLSHFWSYLSDLGNHSLFVLGPFVFNFEWIKDHIFRSERCIAYFRPGHTSQLCKCTTISYFCNRLTQFKM